ncbi:hypothetical protein NRK67_09410 [Fusobacteria bacterium ZRK30]|nr:hypothetical protein NRK67_09410 [Fusobacteria bacterium ZRK30]
MNKEDFFKTAKNDEYQIKTFKKGEFIYTSGWDRKVGYILNGEVLVSKHLSERIILYPIGFKSGEFMGINLYFFDSNNDNVFDCLAKYDDTKIAFLEKKLFEKLLERADFLKMLIYDNEKIILNAIGLTMFLAHGPLGYFAYILDITAIEDKVFYERFLDYCDYLNINKTRLYEITNELIEEQVIVKERKYIEIIDRDRLREYFEGNKN